MFFHIFGSHEIAHPRLANKKALPGVAILQIIITQFWSRSGSQHFDDISAPGRRGFLQSAASAERQHREFNFRPARKRLAAAPNGSDLMPRGPAVCTWYPPVPENR